MHVLTIQAMSWDHRANAIPEYQAQGSFVLLTQLRWGGEQGSGAPKGREHGRYEHGLFTRRAIERRRKT